MNIVTAVTVLMQFRRDCINKEILDNHPFS